MLGPHLTYGSGVQTHGVGQGVGQTTARGPHAAYDDFCIGFYNFFYISTIEETGAVIKDQQSN